MLQPTRPQDIRIETDRFLLRDLERSDTTERACAWLTDPVKARMINAVPRTMTVQQFGDYIAGHDRIGAHLLGVFDKSSGTLIGIWSVHLDWEYSEFRLSVLIGERVPGSAHIRAETQRELLRHLFETLGLETLRCSVLARNDAIGARIFEAAGIEPEHISYNPGAESAAFVEIRHYRVSRDTWRAYSERAASGDLREMANQLGI